MSKAGHVEDTDVLARVRRELAPFGKDVGIGIEEIRSDTSLVDDLAMDSLKFVDLTLALEEALGVDEFPMQQWIDAESLKTDRAFTVSALVSACMELLGDREGAS